jgi:NitT/TauT family transport system permease protein/taurine transport system permease protein
MIAATSGLGYLIADSASVQQTDRTIVGMICMGLLWLFIDSVYLKPFEKATIRRWGTVVSAQARR